MKQLFLRASQHVSFGNNTTLWSSISGQNALSDTFGGNVAKCPVPWDCTVRNLTLLSKDPSRSGDTIVTVMKNGVATALQGTLPAGVTTPLVFSGIDVSFTKFDDICYRVQSTQIGFPGFKLSFCIEIESVGNIFGLCPGGGVGNYGGAFGNGSFSSNWSPAFSSGQRSNSYSICSSPGNVTDLVIKCFAAPGVGQSYVANIRKNGIVQDGTGGTVNTTATISTGNLTASSTFVLPVIKGDHVEVVYVGIGVSSALAAGIGFVPTNADYFMLTGGKNTNRSIPLDYRWNEVNSSVIDTSQMPIGSSKLIARGLYVEDTLSPGLNESFTHTIQRNSLPTPIQVIIINAGQSGLIENQFELFDVFDLITLETLQSAGANINARTYWGLEATVEGAGPQPPQNGSIIVQKIINNGSYPTIEFTIGAGGGLNPSSFILKQNENRIFSDVTPGSGYSITENVIPLGFGLVSIVVNNGSPSSNITVGDGETVVVTITNTFLPVEASGIYKLVPGKLNDTLWTNVDAGTSRDVKKPNPFVKTGLIGE